MQQARIVCDKVLVQIDEKMKAFCYGGEMKLLIVLYEEMEWQGQSKNVRLKS